MKVAYRGQLDAIDQWLRDINNKLTMGISPTFHRKIKPKSDYPLKTLCLRA